MPESLDAALRDLAAEVAFPPTPDLRGAVAARLHERSRRSWAPVAWPRALVLGIAATVLITGVGVAAVLVIPGLRLTFTPSLPTASVPSNALATRLALGDPVALDAVDARVPAILGQPDEVYSARSGEVITLDSRKVILKVTRMWKGAPTGEVTLRVDSPTSFRFAAGVRYLVYTMRSGERQRAHVCSRTAVLARAEEDLKELERLSKRGEAASRNSTPSMAAKSNNGLHLTRSSRAPGCAYKIGSKLKILATR